MPKFQVDDKLKREVIGLMMHDHVYLTGQEKIEVAHLLQTNDAFATSVPTATDPEMFHEAVWECWRVFRGQQQLRAKRQIKKHPLLDVF